MVLIDRWLFVWQGVEGVGVVVVADYQRLEFLGDALLDYIVVVEGYFSTATTQGGGGWDPQRFTEEKRELVGRSGDQQLCTLIRGSVDGLTRVMDGCFVGCAGAGCVWCSLAGCWRQVSNDNLSRCGVAALQLHRCEEEEDLPAPASQPPTSFRLGRGSWHGMAS